MRIKAILLAAAVAGGALATAPMTAARADTGAVSLPLTSFFQMAVDSTHDHLFFSQGNATDGSILVTDFAGQTVATIGNQSGVMGIALSPDGKTLYAALSGLDEVSAISTATLQETAVYPLGGANTPLSVAVQSGRLWVSYDTNLAPAGDGMVGDFNLSAADPALQTSPVLDDPPVIQDWYSAPLLAADPTGRGNVLVALEGGTPTTAESYDTAANPVSLRASADGLKVGPYACGGPIDEIGFVPGGAQFVPACDEADNPNFRYSTADLSGQGAYPSPNYPDAVAIASDTGLVATGVNDSVPDVFVYAPGADTPLDVLSAGSYGLAPGGLGLSADGSRLFAVALGASVSSGKSGGYHLYSYTLAAHQRSSLSLRPAGAASAPAGHALTLGGALSTGGASSVAGASIEIIRSGPDGSTTRWVAAGRQGAFTVTETLPAAGAYSFTASYAGTARVTPAWALATVTATPPGTKVTPALALTASPTAATYRQPVHVTVRLGPTEGNRAVSVYAKTAGATRPVLLKTGAVNGAGTLTLSYPAAHSATLSAVYAGDKGDTARTVTAVVRVSASVTAKLGGYYASKRVGAVTDRLYHHTARLTAAISVAPAKPGECVRLQAQEYADGAWRPSQLTGCRALNARSDATGVLALSHASIGSSYRIRSDYLPGADPSNAAGDSAWQYFIVAK